MVEDVVVDLTRRLPLRCAQGGLPWCTAMRVLVVCGGLLSCKASPPAASAATNVATGTMSVDTATITVPRTYTGQVFVEHDVAVAARAAGMVDSLFVNLGAAVTRDAMMATIDSRAQDIELARAQVALERARNARARALSIGSRGGVTPADSERLDEEYRDAELTIRRTQHELDLTRVTAPFTGVVTARYVRPRQLVAAGDTLFRVAATSPQLVRTRVGESAARSVRIGERAVVVASNGTTREEAWVVFAAPALDAASGTREVILQLRAARLLSGEGVTVELGTEQRRALVVPRGAVSSDGYALVTDGTRTTVRPITTGALVPGDRIEVVNGLQAGEQLAPIRR